MEHVGSVQKQKGRVPFPYYHWPPKAISVTAESVPASCLSKGEKLLSSSWLWSPSWLHHWPFKTFLYSGSFFHCPPAHSSSSRRNTKSCASVLSEHGTGWPRGSRQSSLWLRASPGGSRWRGGAVLAPRMGMLSAWAACSHRPAPAMPSGGRRAWPGP